MTPTTKFHMTFNSESPWITTRINYAEKVVEVWGRDKSLCYLPFAKWLEVADEIGWHPPGAVTQR